jgi:multiple sugar transport system substrate-binding protein
MGVSISKYTTNKDAAFQYLKWLMSKETQQKWAQGGGFTGSVAIMNSPEFDTYAPYNKAFKETIPLVKDFWNVPEYAKMLEVQQEYLNLAITGQMDAKEALDTIADKQQQILCEAYPDKPACK